MSSPARRTGTLAGGEFGELKMNNEKFDFENLVGVVLRGHPSRKPTEGLPYITLILMMVS